MTHSLELLKIDPKITRFSYNLYARVTEQDGKVIELDIKRQLRFKP